jgi:molecular chaperone DnaJ
MPEKDYYKILDVDKKATTDEIKRAFKKSAMQYHPDRPGGDEKKFKEINEAYQILSDTTKRQQYDQFGSNFEQQGGGFNGGMNWEDFMNATRGGGNSQGFAGFDFGDLFGFGGGGRNNQQDNRGRDIQVDVDVEFKEAAFGIEKTLKIRKQTKCSVCHGEGTEPGSKLETCHTCKGQGQVRHQQQTFLGSMSMVSTCPDCQGRGKKADKACKHCGGDGVVSEANEMNIKIPAGINNGESIRLTGQGEAAPHNGGSGDLYVRVRVLPLHGFHRDGFDIYTEVEINFTQAV